MMDSILNKAFGKRGCLHPLFLIVAALRHLFIVIRATSLLFQLFATDVIAYAFQVYKPVNQNEGKENGKEGGDRCKMGVLHSSIDQSHGAKQQQGQFVNEGLCRLRS